MADAKTETTTEGAKKRKAQGPRQVKPLHMLISVRDANGEVLQLTQDQVSIEVVKDPAVLLTKLTTGGMGGAVYVQFTPPKGAE